MGRLHNLSSFIPTSLLTLANGQEAIWLRAFAPAFTTHERMFPRASEAKMPPTQRAAKMANVARALPRKRG